MSPQNEHRQCHHGMGAANVTPAWGQMVSPQHRDSQCLAWAPSLPPHTRAEPSQHRPVPYLGEQRGTLQRGLHQLVQGEEEPLQGALELSHLLPLVEPAMARVTVLAPRCHHATHLPQHCQPLLGGHLPSQLITLVHECLDPWLDLVVSPSTITLLAEPQPWHSHSLGTVTAPPCPQTHSQKLFFFKKKSLFSMISQPKLLSEQFSTIPLEKEPPEPSSPPHQLDQSKANEGILASGCPQPQENCKAEV